MPLQIYDKPVHSLMKDFISDQRITKGQILSRDQIISWFKTKYPKIKLGTVTAHLLRMSINAPSRVHYSVNQNGEDDLFYQIDSGHFRLYDAEIDPQPIYISSKKNGEGIEINDIEESEEEEYQQSGFAYESDLRDFLSKNLPIIESGLHLFESEGITGIEFPVGGRFIDILALDKQDNYVVIELKVSMGYDRVIGQLLRYIAWIENNQADPSQKVRGVIIARTISNDLFLATSKISDVQLFEYDLSVKLRKIDKQKS